MTEQETDPTREGMNRLGITRRSALSGAVTGLTAVGLGVTSAAAEVGQADGQELPNELRLESLTAPVRYRIAVSGSIEFGGEAGENDTIQDGTVEGLIDSENAPDNYRYSGVITSFAITEGDANVFVNGEQVDDPIGRPDGSAETGIVLEQNGQCTSIAPLSGDVPVEDLYEYTYPTERFEGPPGAAGSSFSSEGTTDLQRDTTSVLFLYDGPEGLSLVVVHGRFDGNHPGGTVSFTFRGLPSDGEWVVRDDYYLTDEGEQAESNFDRWNVDGEEHAIDWAYRGDRTDGGAFRGLDSDFEIRIEPAFNDEAPLSSDHDFGPIESWEALSGDIADPDRQDLALDQPVTMRRGECSAGSSGTAGDVSGETDAQITDVSIAGGTFRTGDEVQADVTVSNTGGQEGTFFVGYSAVDPTGTNHSNDGTTGQPVTLASGETTTVPVSWTVESDVPSGTYDARVIVWAESDRNELQTQLDDRRIEAAFEVGDAG